MRKWFALCLTVATTCAAQTYTAVNLQPAGSSIHFANVLGLNNNGEVLGDAVCNVTCIGPNRFPAVWSNGVITPLPMPSGYEYLAQPAYYAINDSGAVVGTLQAAGTNTSHVFVWTNGVPTMLPDAPIAAVGTVCSTNGSSSSFGINRAGHIVGSTVYPTSGPPGTPDSPACNATWVYNGSSFKVFSYPVVYPNGVTSTLPFVLPAPCNQLPLGYFPGVGLGFGASVNDADQVLETLKNFFCGPPYITTSFPASDPFIIQASGKSSLLSLDSVGAATGSEINNIGEVLGFADYGGITHILIWDRNGLHDLGPSGYAHLNNAGQLLYLDTHSLGGSCDESGCFGMWQGVPSQIQLPSGLLQPDDFAVPTALNDAGQFVITNGNAQYLLSPTGACGQDVTSQVQISATGYRYNHSTGLFSLIGSVTNTSGSPILGPISLVVDNLSTNASLYGISGATLCATPQGSAYINIGATGVGQALAPGASLSGAINFIDTAQTGITYTLRVIAGPGGR